MLDRGQKKTPGGRWWYMPVRGNSVWIATGCLKGPRRRQDLVRTCYLRNDISVVMAGGWGSECATWRALTSWPG